ncbi:MAG TPA: hypothetical protein VFI38_17500 [Candidatus Acidoferrum sp.]|nr:hypothetical protein [Candidatus Acidoferrum sp.]
MNLFRQWIWPDVSLRRNAESAAQEAFWATLCLSAYRFLWAFILYLSGDDHGWSMRLLVAGLCFAIFAVGLFFRSRIAAFLAFGLYAAESFVDLLRHPQWLALSALVALALFAGVRGTLAYHRFPPKPKDLPSVEQSFQSLKTAPSSEDSSTPPA